MLIVISAHGWKVVWICNGSHTNPIRGRSQDRIPQWMTWEWETGFWCFHLRRHWPKACIIMQCGVKTGFTQILALWRISAHGVMVFCRQQRYSWCSNSVTNCHHNGACYFHASMSEWLDRKLAEETKTIYINMNMHGCYVMHSQHHP